MFLQLCEGVDLELEHLRNTLYNEPRILDRLRQILECCNGARLGSGVYCI